MSHPHHSPRPNGKADQSPWFSNLGRGHLKSYAAGETISRPDAGRDELLLVEAGVARIYLSSAARDLTLCHLGAGGIFSTHTRAWVEAEEPCEVRSWPVSEMLKLIAREPGLGIVAFRDVGQVLAGALSLIEDLAFRPVSARLARFLLRQRQALGSDTIPLDHTGALAQALGTTRQTLSTQINDLIRDGILARPGRRSLILLRPDRLETLAEVSAG